ncbi:MAG: hypothetical protein R3F34_18250 [Planctomycetota bacterium]
MARSSLSPFLFDRAYWQERLRDLGAAADAVTVCPQDVPADLPAAVEELRAESGDGRRFRALLVRHRGATGPRGLKVVLRRAEDGSAGPGERAPDWPDLERIVPRTDADRAVLLVAQKLDRRLEERVLDILRAVVCARKAGPFDGDVELDADVDDDAARITREVLRHLVR